METKTIQINTVELTADPTKLIEYAFYLKAQMKCLEEELRDNEELICSVIEANGGSIEVDNDDVTGKATICTTKTYNWSDGINELIAKKKIIDNKIKAKQIAEIACGAKVESTKRYVRYNVEFK